jgi:hypothetical protein
VPIHKALPACLLTAALAGAAAARVEAAEPQPSPRPSTSPSPEGALIIRSANETTVGLQGTQGDRLTVILGPAHEAALQVARDRRDRVETFSLRVAPVSTPTAPPGPLLVIRSRPPAPAAGPARPWAPFGLESTLFGGLDAHRETFAAGDTQLRQEGLPGAGARLVAWGDPGWPGPGWLAPEWFTTLHLEATPYAFQDAHLPLSIHARTDWRGSLDVTRRVPLGPAWADVGLGYMGRLETAIHSAAPPTPSYAFSSLRAFHGPQLVLRGGWRLEETLGFLPGGGWRLVGAAVAAPLAFAVLDPGLLSLPGTAHLRAELALQKRWGALGLELGYRYWGLHGAGFDEAYSGPTAGLSWTLSP